MYIAKSFYGIEMGHNNDLNKLLNMCVATYTKYPNISGEVVIWYDKKVACIFDPVTKRRIDVALDYVSCTD